jgi:transcription elongation GreA/GreB family factor
MEKEKLKEQIRSQLITDLDEKITLLHKEIASTQESRNADTKSSAGDKYETGRAMAQMELEKNQAALSRTIKLRKELLMMDLEKKFKKVEFGSLVFTKQGNYFISFGLGKITISKQDYYAISLGSPIGKALYQKTSGDTVVFQGREIIVLEVV